MITMQLSDAARAMNTQLIGADTEFFGVSSDTRSLRAREIFFALKGERFDAHDLIERAIVGGAAGVVTEREMAIDAPKMLVKDSRRALGRLAGAWRDRFELPVIAITGSNGKTTVKELLASILRGVGQVHATHGNLNNDIGVPQTLFGLDAAADFLVLEMGANHPGEIAWLGEIGRPSVAVVTMCAPAHLEGFGDIDGVARAKGELYSSLGANGIAVINADDAYADMWRTLCADRQVISFGLEHEAAVSAHHIELGLLGEGVRFRLRLEDKEGGVCLPLDGRHNIANALAASACAHALGIDLETIVAGLENGATLGGRVQLRHGVAGMRIIDDTYNANPASLTAAIDLLSREPGQRWLLLGDMGELGAASKEIHYQMGAAVKAANIDRFFTIGELAASAVRAFGQTAEHFESRADLIDVLRAGAQGDVTLLIKGSRFMRLEEIVHALSIGDAPC